MKKNVLVTLIVFSLFLSACGNSDTQNKDEKTTQNKDKAKKLVLKNGRNSNVENFDIKVATDLSKLVMKTINNSEVHILDYKKEVVVINFFKTT